MGRPKGSKNKPKGAVAFVQAQATVKATIEATVTRAGAVEAPEEAEEAVEITGATEREAVNTPTPQTAGMLPAWIKGECYCISGITRDGKAILTAQDAAKYYELVYRKKPPCEPVYWLGSWRVPNKANNPFFVEPPQTQTQPV